MNWIEFIVWDILWGIPLVLIVLFVGLYLSVRGRFFQILKFPVIIVQGLKGSNNTDQTGVISPRQATLLSIGAVVGVGNIGGVAAAIAIGGPGAIFWMWAAGLLGMIVKMTEVSLAVHYRSKDKNDEAYGGPTYYINKGIGRQYGFKKLSKILNFIFIFGFATGFIITIQNYTISEAVASTYNMNQVTVSFVYMILLYIMIAGGLAYLAKIANFLVPFMVLFYFASGIYIILVNINALPDAFSLIISSAFTGTSAVGGFAGATVAVALKVGLSRAVFTNEAGWGSSAMIHATAKTDHPIDRECWVHSKYSATHS